MEVLSLVEKLWGFVVRRWLRFPLLRRHYEAAFKKAAEGKKELADAAIQILREGFFDKFVKPPDISVEKEFTEFLHRLSERLPQVEGLEEFLECAYRELATSLRGDEIWGDLSKEIAEFLQRRREEPREALREEQPIVPATSHFRPIPNHDNFLDRQSELEQLRAWLEEKAPKIGVLVGIGGQGKTYLAAKFAEECQQNGWQVRWAEFKREEQSFTTEQFLQSIACEMEQRNDPYAPIVKDPKQPTQVRWDNAVRFLESQPERWLIVLDDFQKATDPKWDEILQFFDRSCRRTKVLVTTRKEPEALRGTKIPTGAHKIFDVPELPKEVAQDYLRAEGLSVDEATSVRIWEKCEGNPMAMKLFAQAARRRSIERVLALPLPAWPEHAAEWMDELLADPSEPAKEVAKRLSIFDEPVEEDLLLAIGATEEGLWELQDFRLADRTVDERWREHDLLREYWQTKLSDQERRDWHRKAGEWLGQQAENLQAAQSERDPEAWSLELQQTWTSYLRRAFWHFVAAREAQPLGRRWWKQLWQWLFTSAGEAQLALQTASRITSFLHRWGEWDKLLRLCQKSLQLAKESGDEKAVADWTHRLAMCLHDRGDYEEAERLYWESLEIFERLRNLSGKAVTLHQLGVLAQKRGDYEEAERLYRESLEIFEWLGDLAGKAKTLHNLGVLARKQDDYEKAKGLLWSSLEIKERLKDLTGKAATLHSLGRVAHKQGAYEEAERLYRESLEIKERLRDSVGKAKTLHQLGVLAQNRGDYEEAERLYRESLKIEERLGDLAWKAATLHQLGRLQWAQGRKAEAEELLRQALDIFERIGHRRAEEVRKDLERLQSESA
jgi:tetratricopeptide (TPR) repeat protein/ATP:corrinoid adenosyltransferase